MIDKSDGISLLPLLRGNSAEQQTHEFLFWDFAGKGGQNAVRMGKWKGVKRGLKKNPHAPLQLYDLDKDISEKHNVAKDHPELVAKLEAIIRRERRVPELERFRLRPLPDATIERQQIWHLYCRDIAVHCQVSQKCNFLT